MRLTEKIHVVVVSSLLFVASVLVLLSNFNTSPVWDEPTYIAAGYFFLKTGNPAMMAGEPMLAKEIAALPLLAVQPSLPSDANSYVDFSYVKFAYDFFYQSGNNPNLILFLSRLPFILLFIGLGLVVYRWSSQLYGKRAGVFAVFLYSFSPLILANAGVALTDFVVTAFIFLTIYFFWRFLQSPNKRFVILTGISLGLALASKATANYLYPIMILLFFIAWRRKQLPNLPWSSLYMFFSNRFRPAVTVVSFMLIISVIAAAVVWIVFGFQFGTLAGEAGSARYLDVALDELSAAFPDTPQLSSLAETAATKIPVPFPSYIAMHGIGLHAALKPRISGYLNGNTYVGGKWQYYFVAFFLKTPLPFLLILFFTILALPLFHHKQVLNEYFLLLPAVFLFLVFLPAQFNVGLRHLMPIYPFLFVFSSKLANLISLRRFLFSLLIVALSLWYVFGTISIHPHYNAYFNEFVGPENGHKYLVSLSEGSNLPRLKAYMDEQRISSIQLGYVGNADPAYYGINYTYLPSPYFQGWDPNYSPQLVPGYVEDCTARTGLIAISASNLHSVNLVNKSCYSWLEKLTPIDQIGYTIFIYDVTEADLK